MPDDILRLLQENVCERQSRDPSHSFSRHFSQPHSLNETKPNSKTAELATVNGALPSQVQKRLAAFSKFVPCLAPVNTVNDAMQERVSGMKLNSSNRFAAPQFLLDVPNRCATASTVGNYGLRRMVSFLGPVQTDLVHARARLCCNALGSRVKKVDRGCRESLLCAGKHSISK